MIHIQVKAENDPSVLAELIASTQGESRVDPKLAVEAELLRELQAQAERNRLPHEAIETVNFTKLDDDTDWTDVNP